METIDEYLLDKRKSMTSTMKSLIADLKAEEKKLLLENSTLKDLVDNGMEIYTSQFLATVDGLGPAGANEIAWDAALEIFKE